MTCLLERKTHFRETQEGYHCRVCNKPVKPKDFEKHKASKGHRSVLHKVLTRGFGDGKRNVMA